MEQVIKDKLAGVVELLNDPDTTVMDTEVIEKLEKIIAQLKDQKGSTLGNDKLNEKLETTIDLINNVMANPDVDVEYCVPDAGGDPYIHLKYMAGGTHVMNQNIPLKRNYLEKTPQDLANLVTFYIERFIEQIDSVESGAQ